MLQSRIDISVFAYVFSEERVNEDTINGVDGETWPSQSCEEVSPRQKITSFSINALPRSFTETKLRTFKLD